jgi:hypothetical protein
LVKRMIYRKKTKVTDEQMGADEEQMAKTYNQKFSYSLHTV